KNREAFARQDLIEPARRVFQNHLRRGPAVNVDDQGNLAGGWRVRRKQQASVQRRTVLRFELQEFRSPQSVFRNFIAPLPYRKARAAHGAQRNSRGGEGTHERLLVVFAIVGEFADVKPLVTRKLLQTRPIKLDREEMALPGIALVGIK